jgi:integrase
MASIKRRPDGRWRARYRDPDGREHARHFERQIDAQRWLDGVTASLVRGDYIDPKAGKITFGVFATDWLTAQTFDDSTREVVTSRLKNHIMPTFEKKELRAVRASTVQAWLRSRQEHCAPRFVRVLLANLSSIFGAAVEDGLISRNPCASRAVRAPAVEQTKVIPWSSEQVAAVIDAHPERWSAAPVVAAGCGPRQGEVFGLRVEDVDFLGRQVLVRQQVKLLGGRPSWRRRRAGRAVRFRCRRPWRSRSPSTYASTSRWMGWCSRAGNASS